MAKLKLTLCGIQCGALLIYVNAVSIQESRLWWANLHTLYYLQQVEVPQWKTHQKMCTSYYKCQGIKPTLPSDVSLKQKSFTWSSLHPCLSKQKLGYFLSSSYRMFHQLSKCRGDHLHYNQISLLVWTPLPLTFGV